MAYYIVGIDFARGGQEVGWASWTCGGVDGILEQMITDRLTLVWLTIADGQDMLGVAF